ncbi:MAG: HesA/MoeB/ThiF family protein, partial [Candidatus Fonsibacter sp.]
FMPEIPNLNGIDCQSEGILGTIGGIVGTIIANETLKDILNFKNSIIGKILIINSENLNFKFVKLNKNKLCKTNCIYQRSNV